MSTLAPEQPRASNVEIREHMLIVKLEDAREIHVPLECFPRLRDATEGQRANWRLVGRGIGVHWPDLDEDISVRGLLAPTMMVPEKKTA